MFITRRPAFIGPSLKRSLTLRLESKTDAHSRFSLSALPPVPEKAGFGKFPHPGCPKPQPKRPDPGLELFKRRYGL
jgi:hypothetical protein